MLLQDVNEVMKYIDILNYKIISYIIMISMQFCQLIDTGIMRDNLNARLFCKY